MYLDFFQLQREPFQVTPDPAFFYFSLGHREALAAIIYGVEQRKGFIALTGEVGVGKTTILRAFLEQIDKTRTKVIYLLNANVAFDDLLTMLLLEFGASDHGGTAFLEDESPAGQSLDSAPSTRSIPPRDYQGESTFQRVNQLHRHLIEHFRQDRNVVLIIDEAQNMSAATLEGLRVLSNLETATDKLLQIVFSGQPEFDEQLARPELRQLRQRIAVRATVKPLTDAEAMRYIQHRLAMAGVPESAIFTPGAIRHILREAQGIPRLLNILCDNALVTAFGYQARQIKVSVAKEVIADRKTQANRRPLRWRIPATGVAVAAMLTGIVLSGSVVPLPGSGDEQERGGADRSSTLDLMSDSAHNPVEAPRPKPVPPMVDNTTAPSQPSVAAIPDTSDDAPLETAANEPMMLTVSEQHSGPRVAADTATGQSAHATDSETVTGTVIEREPVTRVVQPGDRLLDLVEDVYGTRDERLVQLVTKHNPQIKSSHLIRIGDLLVFPPDAHQESTQ